MNIEQYVSAELLALVPLLNGIGFWLKNKTKLNNKWIPLVLGAFGILFSATYTLSTCEQLGILPILTSITQGIILASVSVYANQIYKQAKGD